MRVDHGILTSRRTGQRGSHRPVIALSMHTFRDQLAEREIRRGTIRQGNRRDDRLDTFEGGAAFEQQLCRCPESLSRLDLALAPAVQPDRPARPLPVHTLFTPLG
jgi:hypothetical protein